MSPLLFCLALPGAALLGLIALGAGLSIHHALSGEREPNQHHIRG